MNNKRNEGLNEKHTRVVDRKLKTKDVNPLLKINYDGKSYKDTKGPRPYSLPKLGKGEKRGRVLFVMMDQYDVVPYWTSGPAYLSAVLEANDYHVEVFHGTVYHLTPKDLEKYLLEREPFDYIGFGFLTNYVHDLIKHVKACRAATPTSKIILGSNGYSPLPAFYLEKVRADYGVSGEAENSLLNLLNALSIGESVEDIPSVSFRDGEDIYVSDLREPVPLIDTIPIPAYHLFPVESYAWYEPRGYHAGVKAFPITTSRGCPFRCNFCYRLEEGFRVHSFDHVIAEIKLLNERYGISHFLLDDELFMISANHAIEFSNNILSAMDSGIIPRITWEAAGRFNIVNQKVAEAMAASGCTQILYGLESGDTKVLELMNKKTSAEMVEEGIRNTKNAGMSVSLPCMFGNIGETEESIWKTVDILKRHHGTSQRLLRPVSPYPGSPLYQYALDNGLLEDHEHYFELSKNPDLMTINFTEMDDKTFYRVLYEANAELIDSHYNRLAEKQKESFANLYNEGDDSTFSIVDHRS